MIRKGYKQTEAGIIPEDWDVAALGDIAGITMGQSPSSKYYNRERKGMPFIQGNADVCNRKTIKRVYTTRILKQANATDILMSVRAPVGEISRAMFDVALGRGVCAIRFPNDFLYYMLIFSESQWVNMSRGSTFDSVNSSDIKKFIVALPSCKKEQETIAGALSDADAWIESIERLIAKKRLIKQGAMQQLLTGKTRLPGFSGAWLVKPLLDIAQVTKGEMITKKSLTPGSIPVIAGGMAPCYFHNKPNRHGKTITISGSGASAGYVALHHEPIFASDCSTIGESPDYSIRFIYYFLNFNQDKIYALQTGGAQPHVYPIHLKSIMISCPPLDEQSAVAQALTDMDAEIAQLERKLAKARQIKQGLTQNLLSGIIRLI